MKKPSKEKKNAAVHDGVFKKFLSNPDTARDLLELHLPEHLRSLCDLSTLEMKPGSFIEKNLKPFYSDILYRVQTSAGQGYIYITIEHQSTADKLIGFRLMRYAIAAMQQHLDEGNDRPPLVIPLLFYAGSPSPHPYPVNWLATFDDPALAQQVYTRDFPLADITVIPDDELMRHRSVALLSLVMKHIRQRDMMELLDKIAALVIADSLTDEQLISLINYIIHLSEKTSSKQFIEDLAQRVPQRGETIMTIAEQLRHEGKLEEAARIARNLLEQGLPVDLIAKTTGLPPQEVEKLKH